MGWRVRLANDSDRSALAAFRCDSGVDCASCGPDGGNAHELEVQDYIQRHAVNSMLQRAPHNGHRLLLLEDGSGIVGVVAHEQHDLSVDGEPVPVRRLVVAAVELDHQGMWLEDHRVSSHLLAAALADGQEQAEEPLVTATVAACNARSRALLARHKITRSLSSTGDDYLDLVGVYDDVLKSLPAAKRLGDASAR